MVAYKSDRLLGTPGSLGGRPDFAMNIGTEFSTNFPGPVIIFPVKCAAHNMSDNGAGSSDSRPNCAGNGEVWQKKALA